MPQRASTSLQPVLRTALLLILVLLAASGPVRAQIDANAANQAAAKQPASPAPEPQAEDDSMITLILNSGITGIGFMIVLGLFSMGAVTVTIERLFNVRREVIMPKNFVRNLQGVCAAGEQDSSPYQDLCADNPSPMARILGAGLLRLGRPPTEIEKTMEDAANREMAAIRSRIRPLNVIGSVAPLVGLLGTVLGMIIAFRTASQAGLGKGELMAQGIYMALLTTAAGLTVAIPCLLLSAWFHSRVEHVFRQIDEHLMATLPQLGRLHGHAPDQTQDVESPATDRTLATTSPG
ncbi:MAG: MotA/TolQ/ExbB proton channel family protein [Planctomycetaceae bacterium]